MIEFIFNYIIKNFGLQLLGATLIFAFFLKKRRFFPLLFPVCLAAFYTVYHFLPAMRIGAWFNVKYLVTFAMVFAAAYVCFASSVRPLLFCCLAGYLVQHLSYQLMFILFLTARKYLPYIAYFFCYTACFALPYTLSFFVFARRIRKNESPYINNIYLIGIASLVAAATQVVSMYMNNREAGNITGRIYAVIACIVTLLFLFGLFEKNRLRREKERIEQLLTLEERQHDASKENIELINMKCHDLKKQIALIRHMTDKDQREESLREIEKAVFIYEAAAKTGNEALDVVLTEKNLQCEKHRIKFEYMADGKALGFMKAVDIYTLFGNMLDNAVESVVRESDLEKRIVSLAVSAGNGIVSIHMENYCGRRVEFVDGLPLTTKKDKAYHGFGMKSIRYIVDKYGGNLLVSNDGELFCVDIMIIPKN